MSCDLPVAASAMVRTGNSVVTEVGEILEEPSACSDSTETADSMCSKQGVAKVGLMVVLVSRLLGSVVPVVAVALAASMEQSFLLLVAGSSVMTELAWPMLLVKLK